MFFLLRIFNFNSFLGKTMKWYKRHTERSQKQCDILKFIKIIDFGKNGIKHPKITKYHQNLDVLGNMLLTIKAETFFQKNVAKIEVTCRNKGIPRNWHIFVASTARTLIFHILSPKTCFLNISKKVPKIFKILLYFEVTSSRNIFCRKTKTTQKKKKKKNACSTSETK